MEDPLPYGSGQALRTDRLFPTPPNHRPRGGGRGAAVLPGRPEPRPCHRERAAGGALQHPSHRPAESLRCRHRSPLQCPSGAGPDGQRHASVHRRRKQPPRFPVPTRPADRHGLSEHPEREDPLRCQRGARILPPQDRRERLDPHGSSAQPLAQGPTLQHSGHGEAGDRGHLGLAPDDQCQWRLSDPELQV